MYIAENIKNLRNRSKWTQEEMAETIGISPQSISKWERGETYPDITLLPTLSNLFKVSIDELVGMDKINDAQAKASVFKAGHENLRRGDYSSAIEIFSEALKKYPNDEALITELSMALALDGGPENLAQAINLAEKVLSASPSEKTRHTIRAALSFIYLKSGEGEKATWIAESLPHMRESREQVLAEFNKNPDEKAINTYLRFIALGESGDQETIAIEFHESMVAICFEHNLLGKIKELRNETNGLKKLPHIRVRDNIHLPPNHVRVRHYAEYVLDKTLNNVVTYLKAEKEKQATAKAS